LLDGEIENPAGDPKFVSGAGSLDTDDFRLAGDREVFAIRCAVVWNCDGAIDDVPRYEGPLEIAIKSAAAQVFRPGFHGADRCTGKSQTPPKTQAAAKSPVTARHGLWMSCNVVRMLSDTSTFARKRRTFIATYRLFRRRCHVG